eukprot:jgi/Galph1/4774/GphlegSOOS_G3483.1
MVFAGLLRWLLNRLLRRISSGTEISSFQIDWRNGIVTLKKFYCTEDFLSRLFPVVPFRISGLYVGNLVFKIPLWHRFLETIEIELEDVSVYLETVSSSNIPDFDTYSRQLENCYSREKKKKLKRLQQQLEMFLKRQHAQSSSFLEPWMTKIVLLVFAKCKAIVNNIHVRLDDLQCNMNGPLTCGVLAESILIDGAYLKHHRIRWELDSLDSALDIHKYFFLRNFCVYMFHHEFPFPKHQSLAVFVETMVLNWNEPSCLKYLMPHFLITPVSLNGGISLLFPPEYSKSSWKLSCHFQTNDLNLITKTESIQSIVSLSKFIVRHVKITKQRMRLGMPLSRPRQKESAVDWWHYAFRCVRQQLSLPIRVCPLCSINNSMKECNHPNNSNEDSSRKHAVHDSIEMLMHTDSNNSLLLIVYIYLLASYIERGIARTKTLYLESYLMEEQAIFGRLVASYLIYSRVHNNILANMSSSNTLSMQKDSKRWKKNLSKFMFEFEESSTVSSLPLNVHILLSLSQLNVSAFIEDVSRSSPLVSLIGHELSLTFSTMQPAQHILPENQRNNGIAPVLSHLFIESKSLALHIHDEYAPQIRKVSTLNILASNDAQQASLSLLLCLFRNKKPKWTVGLVDSHPRWIELLTKQRGPLLYISMSKISTELFSLETLMNVIRFSSLCVPQRPTDVNQLSSFRVAGNKEFWTHVCRKLQLPKMQLLIDAGTIKIHLVAKDLSMKPQLSFVCNHLYFRNSSCDNFNMPNYEEDISFVLYQNWILQLGGTCIDISIQQSANDSFVLFQSQLAEDSNVDFSTCAIPWDIHLPSLLLGASVNCTVFVDMTKMDEWLCLLKDIRQCMVSTNPFMKNKRQVMFKVLGNCLDTTGTNKDTNCLLQLCRDGSLYLCLPDTAKSEYVHWEHSVDNLLLFKDGTIYELVELVKFNEMDYSKRGDNSKQAVYRTLKMENKKQTFNFHTTNEYDWKSLTTMMENLTTCQNQVFIFEEFMTWYKQRLKLHTNTSVSLKALFDSSKESSTELEIDIESLACSALLCHSSPVVDLSLKSMRISLEKEKNGKGILLQIPIKIDKALLEPVKSMNSKFILTFYLCLLNFSEGLTLKVSKQSEPYTNSMDSSIEWSFAITLQALEAEISSCLLEELLAYIRKLIAQLPLQEKKPKGSQAERPFKQKRMNINMQLLSSNISFMYPNVSLQNKLKETFPSSFRQLSLCLSELDMNIQIPHASEQLFLDILLRKHLKVVSTVSDNNSDDYSFPKENILSFNATQSGSALVQFQLFIRKQSEDEKLLGMTFVLRGLRSFYNHFAIMDLVVTILRLVAIGNASEGKKNIRTLMTIQLDFLIDNPKIGLAYFENNVLHDYFQCDANHVDMTIKVAPRWNISQGFSVVLQEKKQTLFVLLPLLYPTDLTLNLKLGQDCPLSIVIASPLASILLASDSVLGILRLVFPSFVTYPYILLQMKRDMVAVSNEKQGQKRIMIQHHFDKLDIQWLDQIAEKELGKSVFAMDMETAMAADNCWESLNTFLDSEWIRNECDVKDLKLDILIETNDDGRLFRLGIELNQFVLRETCSNRSVSYPKGIVFVDTLNFCLLQSAVSTCIEISSASHYLSAFLRMGTTGSRQLITFILGIVKKIPVYIRSIQSTTSTTNNCIMLAMERKFEWHIQLPCLEIYYIAGIDKKEMEEIYNGLHEVCLQCDVSMQGTVVIKPILKLEMVNCILNQLVCRHQWLSSSQNNNTWHILIPLTISLKFEQPSDSVSVLIGRRALNGYAGSLIFYVSPIEGSLYLEDVLMLLGFVKECKYSFSIHNEPPSPVYKSSEDAVIDSNQFQWLQPQEPKTEEYYECQFQMEDIRLSIVSYERSFTFGLVELTAKHVEGNGQYSIRSKDFSLRLHMLLQLSQFAAVHGTWNILIDSFPFDCILAKALEEENIVRVHVIMTDSIQLTVTETWIQSLITFISKWKDISIIPLLDTSHGPLQMSCSLKEHQLSLKTNDYHEVDHVLGSLEIRNESCLPVLWNNCRWASSNEIFCDDVVLEHGKVKVVKLQSRALDRIHQWPLEKPQVSDNNQDPSLYLEQSVKVTISFPQLPLKCQGRFHLYQENVYFLPVLQQYDSTEIGTLCLDVELSENLWKITIRSVFKFVNVTHFPIAFLIEDSIGNTYDATHFLDNDTNQVLHQLYQVPLSSKTTKRDATLASNTLRKRIIVEPDASFPVPFIFCCWTFYTRFSYENRTSTMHGDTSDWSVGVAWKEECILKQKQRIVFFPMKMTAMTRDDIVVASWKHWYKKDTTNTLFDGMLAEKITDAHTSPQTMMRPLNTIGAILLKCQQSAEIKIMAPLRLKNELTLAVSYRIYVGREKEDCIEWVSWKELEGRLQPGESVEKYCFYDNYYVAVEWFDMGTLIGSFVAPDIGFPIKKKETGSCFLCVIGDGKIWTMENWNNYEKTMRLKKSKIMFLHEDSRSLELDYSLSYHQNDGSWMLSIGCPYWIANCTGIPLLFCDVRKAASISPVIENVQLGVKDISPVMISMDTSRYSLQLTPILHRKGICYLSIWVPHNSKSMAIPVSILGFHSSVLKIHVSYHHRLEQLAIYTCRKRLIFESTVFLRLNICTQLHASYEGCKTIAVLPETLFSYAPIEQDSTENTLLERLAFVEREFIAISCISVQSHSYKNDALMESEAHACKRNFQWINQRRVIPLVHQTKSKYHNQQTCIRIGWRALYHTDDHSPRPSSSDSNELETWTDRGYYFLWSHWFTISTPSEFTVAVEVPRDVHQLRRIQSHRHKSASLKPEEAFNYSNPQDWMLERIFVMVRISRDPNTRTQFIIVKKVSSESQTQIKNHTPFQLAYAQERFLQHFRLLSPHTEEPLAWSDPLSGRVVCIFLKHRDGVIKHRCVMNGLYSEVIAENIQSCDEKDIKLYQLQVFVELQGRVFILRLEGIVKENLSIGKSAIYSTVLTEWKPGFLFGRKRKSLKSNRVENAQPISFNQTPKSRFIFRLTIPFIGISLIDDEQLWEELLYVGLENGSCVLVQAGSKRELQLTLNHFQCDLSLAMSSNPVLLTALQRPFLSIDIRMQSFNSINQYDMIQIAVGEFAFKLDNELLFHFLEMVKQRRQNFTQVWQHLQPLDNIWRCTLPSDATGIEDIYSQLIAPYLNVTDLPSIFEKVVLNAIACRFSFTMKSSFEEGLFPTVESWMKNTGLLLGEIEDNLLGVEQLELSHAVDTLSGLSRRILWHVLNSLWSNMFTALGGLSALGDMTSSVSQLRQGTLNFFVEPARGSLSGDAGFLWKGVHRGTIMLGRSCIYSIAQPVSRLSWAIAKAMAYGSMNRSFLSQLNAHEEEWKHATDIWDGTLIGLERWRTCLQYACQTSSLTEDVNNERNAVSLQREAKSSLVTISSILTLPFSGFFFFLSNVAQGTRNMTGLQTAISERIRLPRYIMTGYPISSYDAYAAKGQYLLRQTSTQRKEKYVMHIEQQPLENPKTHLHAYILSTSHVTAVEEYLVSSSFNVRKQLFLLWRIPLTSIQHVEKRSEAGEVVVEIKWSATPSSTWHSALQWLHSSRMMESSTHVITSWLKHGNRQIGRDITDEKVIIRQSPLQQQTAIQRNQPTLIEWEEKLSSMLTIHE